jgi:polyisoprenoid-binding protein YceI
MRYVIYLFFLLPLAAAAQNYKPVDTGSKVHFVIKNFGINTGGDFTGLKGDINFVPDDVANCKFDVSVAANTIDTDNSTRDNHLRSDEYFDVAKYPEIRITSTRIDKTNKTADGFFYFTGNLTMHGVTKPISFPFQVRKANNDYLFTGEFEIARVDYGVGEKSSVLGNKVIVTLSVLAKKK